MSKGGEAAEKPLSASLHQSCLIAAAILVVAGIVAYANSLSTPFVFDGTPSIVTNQTIRHLNTATFSPPHDLTTSGRPILNLSLALDYAVGKLNVTIYHATNLAIHLLAGLLLFAVIRRTLPATAANLRFAAAVAILWVVHPLQTESVTYVIQRAESLMGLFFLFSLYGFVRMVDRPSRRWAWASVIACALGMATKEVMVVLPVVVFLYDRTFVAGTFAQAWKKRRGYYGLLAATWIILAVCVAQAGSRNGTAGFTVGTTWFGYALVQFTAIVRYLKLSLLPTDLTFYYGSDLVPTATAIALCGVVVAILVTATVWALVRHPKLGFLAAIFFLILAPTSSVVPVITEPIAEHRMYLPLAAILLLIALALQVWARRASEWTLGAAILGCVLLTIQRNMTYESALILWTDTVEKLPGSFVAHNNLGVSYAALGRSKEAAAEYERALAINQRYPDAYSNLGYLDYADGKDDEAIAAYRKALKIRPEIPTILVNIAEALARKGETVEAEQDYRKAAALRPDSYQAQIALGNFLQHQGQSEEAVRNLRKAVALEPEDGTAHFDLANALSAQNALQEALAEYRLAIQLKPELGTAHNGLALALQKSSLPGEALAEYDAAIRINPKDAEAQYNRANLLLAVGRVAEAAEGLQAALSAKPAFPEAELNLGNIYLQTRQLDLAIGAYRRALALRPDFPDAQNNLDVALRTKARLSARP